MFDSHASLQVMWSVTANERGYSEEHWGSEGSNAQVRAGLGPAQCSFSGSLRTQYYGLFDNWTQSSRIQRVGEQCAKSDLFAAVYLQQRMLTQWQNVQTQNQRNEVNNTVDEQGRQT